MATASEQLAEPVESSPAARTMCEAFLATAERYPDEPALSTHDGTVQVSFGEYLERARAIATGLAALGVRRGDTVALLMCNRLEFYPCDLGAVFLGATPFSIYATASTEQISYLFENSGCRVVFTEAGFLDRVLAARGERSEPAAIVCVDAPSDGVMTLAEVERLKAQDFDLNAAIRAVEPDDALTLIYTSGTTGPPKGVETTHANMLAQCRAVGSILPMRPGARITSYLPSAHIADRWSSHYNQMVWGTQIVPVPDPREIAAVLPAVRPTIWGAVPRVVEKLKTALELAIAAEPDAARREAVLEAIALASERVRLQEVGDDVPTELAERVEAIDAQVLAPLRARIGLDRTEWIVIGAAPLARDVHEFLLAIGLPITEIYGMSEASCCITMAHPAAARIGSVGPAIPGLETRVADDGELLIKGPTVTPGYRNDIERTEEAIDGEGWLHTGDIVAIDDDGFITIVDRKKEMIVGAGGKNMSPANIEGLVKAAHPLIGQIAVVGDRRPYNVALVVLEPEAATWYAAAAGLEGASLEDVIELAAVREELEEAIRTANARLARVEQIKRFELLSEEWLPGGDELTPTMKLKRKPIEEKYAAVIEALYAVEAHGPRI